MRNDLTNVKLATTVRPIYCLDWFVICWIKYMENLRLREPDVPELTIEYLNHVSHQTSCSYFMSNSEQIMVYVNFYKQFPDATYTDIREIVYSSNSPFRKSDQYMFTDLTDSAMEEAYRLFELKYTQAYVLIQHFVHLFSNFEFFKIADLAKKINIDNIIDNPIVEAIDDSKQMSDKDFAELAWIYPLLLILPGPNKTIQMYKSALESESKRLRWLQSFFPDISLQNYFYYSFNDIYPQDWLLTQNANPK